MSAKNHTQPPPPPEQITLTDLERLRADVNATPINGNRKNRAPRKRLQFRFWLDKNIELERALGHELDILKSKRRFMPTVRNALRLYLDLRAGHTDVLFELFPWIADQMKSSQTPPDNSDLERVAERAAMLAAQQIAMNMPTIPAPPPGYPVMKPSAAPPAVETKSAPLADAGAIADNFLAFIQ